MPTKDYASTRYSGLDQINTDNVAQLQPAWTFSTGVLRGHEAAPLVVNNTMYVVTPYPNILLALGLTLARQIVERHGGTVTAHSAGPGHGSTFTVRLPALPEPSPARPPARQAPVGTAPVPSRRILIVDDERLSVISWGKLLQREGHAIHTAYDGREALEMAEAFRPEVVLLDLGLPQLTGYEVADRIRHQPWGQGMVLIALTGWGYDADRQRSTAAGFDHHLVKPLEPSALLHLLASLP